MMKKMGHGFIGIRPHVSYEDFSSLKKKLNSELGRKYARLQYQVMTVNQAGTASAVELEEKAGNTIVDITKTEVAIVLSGDTDNASTNGKTYTLTYVDSDDVSHTSVATGTATLNATPVAFVPAIADFHHVTSFVASAADANVIIYAMISGSTVYATISKTTTESTEAQLFGLGSVYGAYSNDDNDYDGSYAYMSYYTPGGQIKYAICATNTTSSTKVLFYEATLDTTAFAPNGRDMMLEIPNLTVTTTPVRDFWRRRWIYVDTTPKTGHNWILCNSDGSAIYGTIEEANYTSFHTRYVAPDVESGSSESIDSWLGKIIIDQTIATVLDCYIVLYWTPKGYTWQHSIPIPVPSNNSLIFDEPIALEPGTEVKFTIVGNLSKNTIKLVFVEAYTEA